jgi:hypothetical protein
LSCKNRFESDGHTNCDTCREKQHQWYLEHKDYRSKYAREWYLKNRELTIGRSHDRYHTKKDEVKAYRIAKRDTACEAGTRVCTRCLKIFERDESDKRQICDYCLDYQRGYHDSEYRSIWEQHFRVKIPEGYLIHHKDGNRDNNNPHNLLCLPRDEHTKLHWRMGDIRQKEMI